MTFQDPAEAFAESIRRLQAQADGDGRFYWEGNLPTSRPVMLGGIPNFLEKLLEDIFWTFPHAFNKGDH